MFPRHRLYFAISFALLCAGCTESLPSPPIPVHPVEGRVTFKGRSLPGALVSFHRLPTAELPGIAPGTTLPTPTGRTDAEGRFRMHTYNGDDGAPAGDYNVAIVSAGASENRNFMAKNTSQGLMVAIPRKYADPARSELAATVKPGGNPELSFDLK